ncbi:hypothetical protein [Saccharomonospora sp. CUA-673]|uniref:hypothetical protein n=1 Tax=Saccharomonospora sp. CUA-673 TaxID=1904969 RepID=UPI0013017DAB|nr:hypothetical protein [Saccharomonospora sp. CUA-673]
MTEVLHINDKFFPWSEPVGPVDTLCGYRLAAEEGAPEDAPYCTECAQIAGWAL